MKKKLQNSLEFIQNRIAALTATRNEVSDDARAEVERTIARLQEVEAALRDALTAAEEGEGDNSEELRAQLAELKRTVADVENAVKTAKTVKKSVKDVANSAAFAAAFMETVKNTSDPREFKSAWREKATAMVKNNIADANIEAGDFLPAFVINEINDQFVGRRHRLLELVDWTGLPVFKALWETGNELGHVHVRGEAKTEQTLTFEPIEIRPDYIYKYITVDQVVLRESRDMNDVLLRYITAELLDRLLVTVENAIVLGTGPFIAPAEVAATNIPEAGAYMQDSDGVVAIMTKQTYYATKATIGSLVSAGGRLATHDDVLAYFGVDEIIFNEAVADYEPTTEGATFTGVMFLRPQSYKLVGDRRPDQYEDFNLAYNKREFLTEIYIGGGCVIPDNFIALITTV